MRALFAAALLFACAAMGASAQETAPPAQSAAQANIFSTVCGDLGPLSRRADGEALLARLQNYARTIGANVTQEGHRWSIADHGDVFTVDAANSAESGPWACEIQLTDRARANEIWSGWLRDNNLGSAPPPGSMSFPQLSIEVVKMSSSDGVTRMYMTHRVQDFAVRPMPPVSVSASRLRNLGSEGCVPVAPVVAAESREAERFFPPEALAGGVQGWALVEFQRTRNGKENPRVVETQPGNVFHAAAEQFLTETGMPPGPPCVMRLLVYFRADRLYGGG